ncbi:MAG: hypothetical protein KAX19_05140 [Candidatus Brocadiae bacterium]|nr:hypothetical protein [Candidatus Brocadiia bacterium]
MQSKLYYYDMLGVVVPGTLTIFGSLLLLDWGGVTVSVPALPASVEFAVFLAGALFCGKIIQALGSLLERCYFRTWGGQPSSVLVTGRKRFKGFTAEDGYRIAQIIRAKLANAGDEKQPSDDSVFAYAKAVVNRRGYDRVIIFRALYAYQRGLLTFSLCFALASAAAALIVRLAAGKWVGPLCISAIAALPFVLLFWHRAKQRAYYYAREVLQMAEQELTGG